MQIKQFEDKNLAHYSYAILSECENKIILIDPSRNPKQYLDYASENEAVITGVIETHPHADFVSSHLELHETTGAKIYCSKLTGASYPHEGFDEGEHLQLGKIKLSALNTPGHSPDSICIVLEHDGKQKAVFTGDTLFIGDCGRPDLRPGEGDVQDAALELAKQMYHSLRDKLLPLQGDAIVYPAHGAGTLCGKALSEANSSSIEEERKKNWSLQPQTEVEFIHELLKDQPFVPAYFPYDVNLNRQGAPAFKVSINSVKISGTMTDAEAQKLNKDAWVVDSRHGKEYKAGHLKQSVNIMMGLKFDTWLGSLIEPGEQIYFAAADTESLHEMIERAGAIGYESQILEGFIVNHVEVREAGIDVQEFANHPERFTIIDVRNEPEVQEDKIFESSLSFPLGELRDRIAEIPTDKPIVVHCASGYRSAAGSSLIHSALIEKVNVFDLGEAVKSFIKEG